MNSIYQTPKNLPNLTITIKNGQLVGLDWYQQKTIKLFGVIDCASTTKDDRQLLNATHQQLDEYFLGKRQAFDLPLDISVGTNFQQMVWQALLTIPFGETISYRTLANMIGKPKAYRACANANGKNPISLVIPCHRVVASDGSIGGYTGGVSIKAFLLALEGTKFT